MDSGVTNRTSALLCIQSINLFRSEDLKALLYIKWYKNWRWATSKFIIMQSVINQFPRYRVYPGSGHQAPLPWQNWPRLTLPNARRYFWNSFTISLTRLSYLWCDRTFTWLNQMLIKTAFSTLGMTYGECSRNRLWRIWKFRFLRRCQWNLLQKYYLQGQLVLAKSDCSQRQLVSGWLQI